MEKLIKPVKITSNSLEAIVFRNMNRPFVDRMFKAIDEKIMLSNGKYKYALSKSERKELEIKARNTWRTIIIESNKL